MSTEATTEHDISIAERLDTAVAELVRVSAMSKLWENDYKGRKAMALADLRALGRDEWTTPAGTIARRVTGGRFEWQAAYEALHAAVLTFFEYVGPLTSPLANKELETLRDAAAVRYPAAAWAPWLDVRPALQLPPAVIKEARREGAREALARLRVASGDDMDIIEMTEAVADEMLGGGGDDD